MLCLKNITKEYITGDTKVEALKGISLSFRKNEFVSVLGPSGCGKTTLLNIIGGLDRYTSGDLIIGGKSTKDFKDRHWDSYRNHSVGFVFQSYNLIPHQTVLSNVELALTLSGVSKKERRQRAKEVLSKVGLGDQLNKKPNQMSGGQMQRVAIARALINDPDILLADEPTGALDSETSVQIMEILREVAKDRLVVMVTHNPDLAQEYSTRIIKLLDGKVQDDSMPYESDGEQLPSLVDHKKAKTSMSFATALSLSFKNLMTKKARTILTAFAGSIGIIGIALILSMSNGATKYIDGVERDTLSSYPVQLEKSSVDLGTVLSNMKENAEGNKHDRDKVYSNNIMTGMMDAMMSDVTQNNLRAFKAFVDSGESGLEEYTSEIRYTYSTPLNIYKADTANGIYQVNPSKLFESMGFQSAGYSGATAISTTQSMDVWQQLSGNEDLVKAQYDVIAGKYPDSYNEVVIIVDENNEVTDYTLYALGLLDPAPLQQAMADAFAGNEVVIDSAQVSFSYDDLLSLKFKLLVNTDYFEKQGDLWVDRSADSAYLASKLATAEEISVVGILRPSENSNLAAITGTVGFRGDLMEHLIGEVNRSEIVQEQNANPETDVFTGLPFATSDTPTTYTADDLKAFLAQADEATVAEMSAYMQQLSASGMSEDEIANTLLSAMYSASSSTLEQNLLLMGVADLNDPASVLIFPKDFECKDEIVRILEKYNDGAEEIDQLRYTDYVGLMMSSVTTIIKAISYILISFVAISLVVSSIMIGIITYISVLERTKEIGILRSIGASKRDIGRVFNAETFAIGLVAGILGILVTELLLIPANLIIEHYTDIANLAKLPPIGAVALILISVFLTFIAGLIPSRIASKRDPVIALRTE